MIGVTQAVLDVVTVLNQKCHAQHGDAFAYTVGDKTYRWEPVHRTENGGVYGVVARKHTGKWSTLTRWKRAGSFIIDHTGHIIRGPRWMREMAGQTVPGGPGDDADE